MDPVNNVIASTNNDMIYIHIIITIGVAIITALITHLFALRRERKNWQKTLELFKIQEYNKASAKFRSEFTHILQILDHPSDGTPVNSEIDKFKDKQECALIEFLAYLSDEERENIDSAWKIYACTNQLFPNTVDTIEYFSQEIKEAQKLRKLAFQRIEKLLECAKPK